MIISKLRLIGIGILVTTMLSMVGFIWYYKTNLETAEYNITQMENINKSLTQENNSLQKTSTITIEQLEQLRKNEQQSQQYISEMNRTINALTFIIDNEQTKEVLLKNINVYEECMAIYYHNPAIRCDINIK